MVDDRSERSSGPKDRYTKTIIISSSRSDSNSSSILIIFGLKHIQIFSLQKTFLLVRYLTKKLKFFELINLRV